MISEPQRPGASEVCFAIGEKSAGNYNKLFSDENKCIKIEISIDRTKTVLHSYSKRKEKIMGNIETEGSYDEENRNVDERW